VRFVASPNCDARPDPADLSFLVIHNISLPPGEFGGPHVEQLFTNRLDWNAHPYFGTIRDLKVSAHCVIDRDGRVTQFVPFDQRAWHAGQSEFDGRTGCNDFSVGIELEGTDDRDFTEAQYVQLARVTRALMRAYPKITPARIAGHCDIAPGRKTDPGPHFDWTSFRLRLEYPR
jgi:AmpD protein